MRIWHILFLLSMLAGGAGSLVQPPQAIAPAEAGNDLDQVKWCREGILESAGRPEIQKRWAGRLFLLGTSDSRLAVKDLLLSQGNPEVQRAMCEAIAEYARAYRERLDEVFVQPLMELLGSPIGELRTAAAKALAEFSGSEVLQRLAGVARQPENSIAKRLAAIDALAPNIHRREVVKELCALIELDVPEVSARAIAALQLAAKAPQGADRAKWRAWSAQVSSMSETQWLAEQLQVYRDRALAAQTELELLRESEKRHDSLLSARITEFLRDEIRALPAEQRDAKIVERLKDPLPEVVIGAIEVLKVRLADEGKRPEGAVLTALLTLCKEASPTLRREAVLILHNLNDPVVMETFISRLEHEDDSNTRVAVLRALGKQGNIEAVPALIKEIASSGSHEFVREAALALGQVAARSEAGAGMTEAVVPLKTRYAAYPVTDVPIRAALLSAMAGIGDPAFLPEFLEAIDAEDPNIIRPAIRGLRALGDGSQLQRLRTLSTDKDSAVRLAAVDALGQLGRDTADIEALLPRLSPNTESHEATREAAWKAVLQWCARQPIAERIKVADRFREMPELEVSYLELLVGELTSVEGTQADVETIRDRLAGVYVHQSKYVMAANQLRELYGARLARGDKSASDTGVRCLEATLRGFSSNELSELLKQLHASATDQPTQGRIVETVARYVDSPEVVADLERSRKLLTELSVVSFANQSSDWSPMLERLNDRVVERALP